MLHPGEQVAGKLATGYKMYFEVLLCRSFDNAQFMKLHGTSGNKWPFGGTTYSIFNHP